MDCCRYYPVKEIMFTRVYDRSLPQHGLIFAGEDVVYSLDIRNLILIVSLAMDMTKQTQK